MKEMDISMEEKRNVNKNLLVIFRWTLKLIPMVLAGLQAVNTIISYFGIHIKAFTYSNDKYRVSIVGFNIHFDKYDYINSIVHEAEHIKQAMLDYYNIPDEGENAAYTIAYIAMKMLQMIVLN